MYDLYQILLVKISYLNSSSVTKPFLSMSASLNAVLIFSICAVAGPFSLERIRLMFA